MWIYTYRVVFFLFVCLFFFFVFFFCFVFKNWTNQTKKKRFKIIPHFASASCIFVKCILYEPERWGFKQIYSQFSVIRINVPNCMVEIASHKGLLVVLSFLLCFVFSFVLFFICFLLLLLLLFLLFGLFNFFFFLLFFWFFFLSFFIFTFAFCHWMKLKRKCHLPYLLYPFATLSLSYPPSHTVNSSPSPPCLSVKNLCNCRRWEKS